MTNYTVPGFWDLVNKEAKAKEAAKAKSVPRARCSKGHLHLNAQWARKCEEAK